MPRTWTWYGSILFSGSSRASPTCCQSEVQMKNRLRVLRAERDCRRPILPSGWRSRASRSTPSRRASSTPACRWPSNWRACLRPPSRRSSATRTEGNPRSHNRDLGRPVMLIPSARRVDGKLLTIGQIKQECREGLFGQTYFAGCAVDCRAVHPSEKPFCCQLRRGQAFRTSEATRPC